MGRSTNGVPFGARFLAWGSILAGWAAYVNREDGYTEQSVGHVNPGRTAITASYRILITYRLPDARRSHRGVFSLAFAGDEVGAAIPDVGVLRAI